MCAWVTLCIHAKQHGNAVLPEPDVCTGVKAMNFRWNSRTIMDTSNAAFEFKNIGLFGVPWPQRTFPIRLPPLLDLG